MNMGPSTVMGSYLSTNIVKFIKKYECERYQRVKRVYYAIKNDVIINNRSKMLDT